MRSLLLQLILCLIVFPTKFSGTNAPLPLKTPDVTVLVGSQITSGEMANETGLLCGVDDLPPKAGHPNAQVKGLVPGRNIPRNSLNIPFRNLEQAKQSRFDDHHLEHKFFRHLAEETQGNDPRQIQLSPSASCRQALG